MSEFKKNYKNILDNYHKLENELANINDTKKIAELSKKFSDMTPLVNKITYFEKIEKELVEVEDLISSSDKEIRDVALSEKDTLHNEIEKTKNEIKILLIPKDQEDQKNAIVEIRAGTGGEEAALFASDIFRMYVKYSEIQNWKNEIMDINETSHDGVKEVVLNISGKDVFGKLKFESGTHRVQRVPETESGGRIHTSAATVAVLPEATEIDLDIQEKDLRIDIFRSSGPGGQSVNTTDSAVRITHIPSGIIAQCQDEKSQHKNKAKAMTVLRSRILDAEKKKKEDERAQERKSQVGSGDRSERIRTYNYQQGRVTDHRISLTLYKLDQILNGESLEEIISALREDDQAKKLAKACDD